MPKDPKAKKPRSEASVASGKLERRNKRASVLRRVIYLKRRCIRCNFVQLFFALILLLIQLHTMYNHWHLFMNSMPFLISKLLFVVALISVFFGSLLCIYAMSKKLKKLSFFSGNVMVVLGVTLNAIVFVNMLIPVLPKEKKMQNGYPIDLVEDCEAYPDHTFKFFVKPEKRKGRPVVEALMDQTKKGSSGEEEDSENEDEEETDEQTTVANEEVTETYDCVEMNSNLKWFKVSFYLVLGMLIVTGVTLTINCIGIIHLWYIHMGGLNYSILPPALVEPYEFYDSLMKHNHSVESIPDQS